MKKENAFTEEKKTKEEMVTAAMTFLSVFFLPIRKKHRKQTNPKIRMANPDRDPE